MTRSARVNAALGTIPFALLTLASWLTRRLPMGLQLLLADTTAGLSHRLLPSMHGRVTANVQRILGPGATVSEVQQVARRQWRNYLRYLRDFVALPHSSGKAIDSIFAAAEGWEHIANTMDQGKGAIMASAHFGNWDLAAAAMAQRYPVHVIVDTFTSSRLDKLVNRYRDALNLSVIPAEKPLKRIVAALKRNQAVAFLVDKPVPGDAGVEVQFFGQPTRVPAGAAFFSIKTGAPIVPAFVWRDDQAGFRVRIFPPLSQAAGGDLAGDIRDLTQRLMQCVEEMIRAQPERWYMFRSMWPVDHAAVASSRRLEEAVA